MDVTWALVSIQSEACPLERLGAWVRGLRVSRLLTHFLGTQTCVTFHCTLTGRLPGEVPDRSTDAILPGSAAGL